MGKIICTGLGPGDPDLISVKSDRLIRAAAHVAYFRKAGRAGQARQIVQGMLAQGVTEYAMEYPVTTEMPFDSPQYNDALAQFYDRDANAEMAKAGMEGFQEFMVKPDKVDAILERLEKVRQRVNK